MSSILTIVSAQCVPPLPTDVVVLGIGNTLRGDDGVGYLAAERLWSDAWPGDCVTVEAHRQLLIEHVDALQDATHVVFLDAAVAVPAGEIRITDVAPAPANAVSFHQLTPGALVSLAESLYGRPIRATLVSIGVESMEAGDELSSPVKAAFLDYCETARDVVAELI